MARPHRLLALLLPAFFAAALLPGVAGAAPRSGTIRGTVPQRTMQVQLWAARPGNHRPPRLLDQVTSAYAQFELSYTGGRPAEVDYVVATSPDGRFRVAAALPEGPVPRQIEVDGRSTVAIGFAMAQFIDGGEVLGENPGLRNAAAMTLNLTDLRGAESKVLARFPNGGSTSTEATFNSLANLVTLCHRPGTAACARFLDLAGAPGRGPAPDTLAAVVNIARNPWHEVGPLYQLSLRHSAPFGPSLRKGEEPDAWTLALRFEGDPPGLDGPGNFAIDRGGNLWVANNYAYSRQSRKPACFSDKVFRFTPTGQTYPGSPYVGGGLSGVGFGVTIDPRNRVWLGNFGFEGVGCEEPADHFTASAFRTDGRVLSPPEGWSVGGINWPQGTISDQAGRIWLANCGNDSVTRIEPPRLLSPTRAPPPAVNFGADAITAGGPVAFERPFADAVNVLGEVFVTGNASSSVARLAPDGTPLGVVTGGGLHLPMGIAGDSKGYMWVSNSKYVVAPCPGKRSPKEVTEAAGKGGGTVTLLKPDGQVAEGNPIEGAGLVNPWGIAVDAGDHVWVANFGGKRLSELCGTATQNCPPGRHRVGAAISPPSGYGFDGLVRNTGVAIDPSGNVWLTNNWKTVPIQTNPGGYQIVAYLGLATPTRAPQIGPPLRP